MEPSAAEDDATVPEQDHRPAERPPTGHRRTEPRRRQERAILRRERLLEAAVELLEEGGFTAVTHRAVARRAGVPLAATSYYFTCRAALLAEAFTLLVERELAAIRAHLEAVPADPPDALAEALVQILTHDRQRRLGLWELYLQAGRDPDLQRIARAWTDGCDEIVSWVLHRSGHHARPSQVRFVTTVLSGLWVEGIVEDRPDARRRIREVLTHTLAALRAP
ncbi:TetR/AcrR family transcriptional regulator [Thermobispora bispora]|uniref:TetR/AcrR family transcriptional regulator n=1 Tax=Thermobispora bispora TaxID=2006 RepID=UPI00197F1CBB|nr:TetR family transcriptional regulator [Thermobispora bispora]QSI48284.1 TetR family transcriptional regulator [Thermobispora bispora]